MGKTNNLKRKIKTIYWRVAAFFVRYYYGNPARKLKIVGVTGTSGKTTTATLLYKVTKELGYKVGLISTVENIIIDQVYPTTLTTPNSIVLTKLFYQMLKAGCEYVFMEVSSHSVAQNRIAGIPFTGGIFLNLSQDHLDYHKDMEDYFEAKHKFFKLLPPRAFALTNVDDPRGVRMLQGIQAHPFTYGFKSSTSSPMLDIGEGGSGGVEVLFEGEIKKLDFHGLELEFNGIPIKTNLLGKFNAFNLLAVWSACSLLGFDMNRVNKTIENIEPPRGRFQHFTSSNGVLVIVDYAHKPDALEKIFSAVKETKTYKGRIISVFGCGGDRDPFKRPIMGKTGAVNSDIAIFTSDNPRSEDPEKIIEEMKATLTAEELEKVKTIPDRHKAIQEAVNLAVNGDIILCAGKGHEDYQIIKGIKSHFDDMEELKRAFK